MRFDLLVDCALLPGGKPATGIVLAAGFIPVEPEKFGDQHDAQGIDIDRIGLRAPLGFLRQFGRRRP